MSKLWYFKWFIIKWVCGKLSHIVRLLMNDDEHVSLSFQNWTRSLAYFINRLLNALRKCNFKVNSNGVTHVMVAWLIKDFKLPQYLNCIRFLLVLFQSKWSTSVENGNRNDDEIGSLLLYYVGLFTLHMNIVQFLLSNDFRCLNTSNWDLFIW